MKISIYHTISSDGKPFLAYVNMSFNNLSDLVSYVSADLLVDYPLIDYFVVYWRGPCFTYGHLLISRHNVTSVRTYSINHFIK